MSAKPDNAAKITGSPAEIERVIQQKRDHLASTVNELTARAKPKEIARRGVAEVQRKAKTLTHGPDGKLRTERLAAVGGAVAILGGLLVVLRRRK